MPSPIWNPGDAPYATWLKTRTPEEKQAHLMKRKIKKAMRKAMQDVVEINQAAWITLFNNGAVVLMNKAIEEGDVQAFCAVYDRFIGKPESAVDITSGGKQMQAPTIIFQTEELTEWNVNTNQGEIK